jgi:hypothetical protein
MHMPKTGGTALATALRGHVHRQGHKARLETLPLWPPIVTVVRDPVERWVSGWDMCFRQRHVPQFDRWSSPSAAALDPEALAWLEDYWDRIFAPASWWLRDAKTALARCWYIAHTETLTADFEVIRDALGATECAMPAPGSNRRNANPAEKSTLTPAAIEALREHYAADYALLEGL